MPVSPSSRQERLAALREEVCALERSGVARAGGVLPFGIDEVDRRLAGGLATAALHEIAAARADLSDDAAATLFIAGLVARRGTGTILWALPRFDLFAPGLAAAGLGPARVLYAECGPDEEVLAVMEEGLRHGGLDAVIGEVGRAPMAAARRLQLAAEESGVTALMLRRWRRSGEDPLAVPSPAMTRWRIACAPSAPLPVEGIGRPRWHVELARQRGGERHHWILEACDAQGRLALPGRSGNRPDQTVGAIRIAA